MKVPFTLNSSLYFMYKIFTLLFYYDKALKSSTFFKNFKKKETVHLTMNCPQSKTKLNGTLYLS